MKLGNFFYDCDRCARALRFDDTAQVRVCPGCGHRVELPLNYQWALIVERAQIKAALGVE